MADVYKLRDALLDHPDLSREKAMEILDVSADELDELVSELTWRLDSGTLEPRPLPKQRLTLSELLTYG